MRVSRVEIALVLTLLAGSMAVIASYYAPRAKHTMDYSPNHLPREYPPDQ